jgi:SAM-dependent methyltransferase
MKMALYDDSFYSDRRYSMNSARVIVPLILDLMPVKSVIDIGCGMGEFLNVFKKHGTKEILGIDGEWINRKKLQIPEKYFLSKDLEKPLDINRKFDLVISLEVAEHLKETSAKGFVNSLIDLAPVVLFSAAIPYQGGTSHINEQWPKYWADIFKSKGYVAIDCLRDKICDDERVAYWYAQNILIFVSQEFLKINKKLRIEYEKTEGRALSRVHPKVYSVRSMDALKYNKLKSYLPGFLKGKGI